MTCGRTPKATLDAHVAPAVASVSGASVDALVHVAASVLPPEKALALIDSIDGVATYIAVKESDEAEVHITASKRFAGFLARDVQPDK